MARAKKLPKAVVPALDLYVTKLLEKITNGKRVITFSKGEKIFSQGEKTDAIFFIESGKVKMTVLSSAGKEAVIAVLGPHDFLGEGALVGQTLRVSTAVVVETSVVYRIEKPAMARALQEQADLSEKFIAALVTRNINIEADLCDQLFNSSEKRLARVLLKLSRLPKKGLGRRCKAADAESRDPGRDGRHNAFAYHALHEQIQDDGLD